MIPVIYLYIFGHLNLLPRHESQTLSIIFFNSSIRPVYTFFFNLDCRTEIKVLERIIYVCCLPLMTEAIKKKTTTSFHKQCVVYGFQATREDKLTQYFVTTTFTQVLSPGLNSRVDVLVKLFRFRCVHQSVETRASLYHGDIIMTNK